MSENTPFGLTVVFELNPGKHEKFLKFMSEVSAYVKEHEPYVWTYELTMARSNPKGEPDIAIMREVYENKAGFDMHVASDKLKDFLKTHAKENFTKKTTFYHMDLSQTTGFTSKL
ncbi:hypothetical protein F5Y15DRAFT_414912 [Xylariaceae sp. FL0016]|nr:hypothetical protein F5Y15DRAFT_414912 [Xylariaceae sp. FL0016]